MDQPIGFPVTITQKDQPDSGRRGMTFECRRGVRIPYTTAVELNTVFGPVKCMTRDISSGGMFVDAKFPLSIGHRFELNFRFRSGGHSIKLLAQVIRETREGFGLKLI